MLGLGFQHMNFGGNTIQHIIAVFQIYLIESLLLLDLIYCPLIIFWMLTLFTSIFTIPFEYMPSVYILHMHSAYMSSHLFIKLLKKTEVSQSWWNGTRQLHSICCPLASCLTLVSLVSIPGCLWFGPCDHFLCCFKKKQQFKILKERKILVWISPAPHI